MIKQKYIYRFYLTTILLSLFIISCATGRVSIEYHELVRPITLKGKVVRSFRANYQKDLSKEIVLKMAKSLTASSGKSLDFERLKDQNPPVIILRSKEDASASFEMDTRSGSLLYNAGLAEYKKEGGTPNLVTGQKAEAVTLQHLEKLGLMPKKEELRLEHIGGLNMAELKEDGTTKTYNKLVTVRYSRILSGLVVMGASRIVVRTGENGKLVGLIVNWPEVDVCRRVEPSRLRSNEDIKQAFERRLREGANGAKRIVVQKADLVLYDDGKGQIESAYFVEARLYYEVPGVPGDRPAGIVQKYDVPYDFYVPVFKRPQAFYPYMEKAKIKPTDARKFRVEPKDDE